MEVTEKEIREFRNEIDMLQGNINRMCITDDETELINMRYWAKFRIDKIFDFCQKQFITTPGENPDNIKIKKKR